MSLRARLVLWAAYLLVVVVVALEIPLATRIQEGAVNEFQLNVLARVALIASHISDSVAAISQAGKVETHPSPDIADVVDPLTRGTQVRIVVVDQRGHVVDDNTGEAPLGTYYANPQRPEFRAVLYGGQLQVSTVRYSRTLGQNLVIVAVPVMEGGKVVGAVRGTATLGAVDARIHRSWVVLGLVGFAVVGLGLAVAWLLAGSIARPVTRLEETAARLGEGELGARAEPSGPAEVAALARSFNQMADALSANITAQREFVANASHQLRTPLTGLRLRLESIEDRGGEAATEARRATGEVDRMASLVEDLLQLAAASEAGARGDRIDLAAAAHEAAERWTPQAERAGSTIVLRAGAAPAWARAEDIDHVFDNLIENAIRYTPAGTPITVETGLRQGRPYLAVADRGPGIPPEERERVFERFYRGATGRSAGPGTGLGLAIVAELVRRWGGDARLSEAERGTRIEATLRPPAVP